MATIVGYAKKQGIWSRLFPQKGKPARELRKGDRFKTPAGNVFDVEWANFMPERGYISADGEKTAVVFGVAWRYGDKSGVLEVHPATRFTMAEPSDG